MSNGFPPDPPVIRARAPQTPIANLLARFSPSFAEDVDIFLSRQKKKFLEFPLVRLLGNPFSPEGFGGPVGRAAGSVLPFVQRAAKTIPGLKKGAKTVSPITDAPSRQNRVRARLNRMRERLLEPDVIPGQDPLEVAQELGTKLSKGRVNKILAEHGVVSPEEIQRFRFEVKPGKDGKFDLAKVLAWLGY